MNKDQVKLAVGGVVGLVAIITAGAVLDSVKTRPVAKAPVAAVATTTQQQQQPVQPVQQPVQQQQPQYSDLIVKTNNPAAANSCSTILLRAATVRGLPSNLVIKATDASQRFLKMYTGSVQQLFFNNDIAGYQAAMSAGGNTTNRINALPPEQRDGEVLRAADQCMSIL